MTRESEPVVRKYHMGSFQWIARAHGVSRRDVLRGGMAWGFMALPGTLAGGAELKGRIKQSVCLWCYQGFMQKQKMSLDDFAAACAKLGLRSIELVNPEQWPTLQKHGLICAMCNSHSIPKGLNRKENHEECLARIRKSIDAAADARGSPT